MDHFRQYLDFHCVFNSFSMAGKTITAKYLSQSHRSFYWTSWIWEKQLNSLECNKMRVYYNVFTCPGLHHLMRFNQQRNICLWIKRLVLNTILIIKTLFITSNIMSKWRSVLPKLSNFDVNSRRSFTSKTTGQRKCLHP